jgi:isopenicillin N synthase-like dioxygenase
MTEAITGDVVELDYNDLIAGADLSSQIEKAYGFDGVGLLTVKNVPNFLEARMRLLPLSKQFADLPDETKEKYVHKESYYSFGWSHGKEKLQAQPDLSKGSYYANPQYDCPVDDPEIIAKYPCFVHPNIWPKDDLPELEHAFKELGQLIVSVGKLVAQQCDRYVKSKCDTYPDNMLETVIDKSLCCKARLLHYFPIDAESASKADDSFSSWCGWHNDHGSLTGLTSALYMDAAGNIVENTDTTAGKCNIVADVLCVSCYHAFHCATCFPSHRIPFSYLSLLHPLTCPCQACTCATARVSSFARSFRPRISPSRSARPRRCTPEAGYKPPPTLSAAPRLRGSAARPSRCSWSPCGWSP